MNLRSKLLQFLKISMLCCLILTANVAKSDDWIGKTLSVIASLFGCIKPSDNPSIKKNKLNISLDDDSWHNTGISVKKDKLLSLKWRAIDTELNSTYNNTTKKYRVLYKIDPRAQRSLVFIANYSSENSEYKWDYDDFEEGELLNCDQSRSSSDYCKDLRFKYARFIGRNKLEVNEGDVVNIKILDSSNFFSNNLKRINSDIIDLSQSHVSFVQSALSTESFFAPDNAIISSDMSVWQNYIQNGTVSEQNGSLYGYNDNSTTPGSAAHYNKTIGHMIGVINDSALENIIRCPNDRFDNMNNPPCYFDRSKAITMVVNNSIVKQPYYQFMDYHHHKLFTFQAESDGELDFLDAFNSHNALNFNTPGNPSGDGTKYLTQGRYLFEIEIGKGDNIVVAAVPDVDPSYAILPEATNPGTYGASPISFDNHYRTDAPTNGVIWVKVNNNDDNIKGFIGIEAEAYIGTSRYSDAINNWIVNPLKEKIYDASWTIYNRFVASPRMKMVVNTLLTIYVMIYALFFLMGFTQVTLQDSVKRIIKIAVVVTMFTEQSWTFFTENFLNIFIDGSSFLISNVAAATSSSGNIFGFIDPVIEHYTDPLFWATLIAMLFQFWNGLTFFTIMLIMGIWNFLGTFAKVVVTYLISFMAMMILISLAPLFITFILFEKTKNMFISWVSLIFNYTLQPTLLLMMILVMNQIMGSQLQKAMVESCWGVLLPLSLGLDLGFIGIDLVIRIPLFGLPFLIPGIDEAAGTQSSLMGNTILAVVSSMLAFYTLSRAAVGVIGYIMSLTASITGSIGAGSANKDTVKQISGTINRVGAAPKNAISNYASKKFNERGHPKEDKNEGKKRDDNTAQPMSGNQGQEQKTDNNNSQPTSRGQSNFQTGKNDSNSGGNNNDDDGGVPRK